METIVFGVKKEDHYVNYDIQPVFQIDRVVFKSNDVNWTQRLAQARITVKIDSKVNGEFIGETFSKELLLETKIDLYEKQPIIKINEFYNFPGKKGNSLSWRISLIVSGIHFNDSETLEVYYMDTLYIQKRIQNWQDRINQLLNEIEGWISPIPSMEVKRRANSQQMHEGLMKTFNVPVKTIDGASVYKQNALLFAIKPFGLWLMGANGRLDILSIKGSAVIVDTSEAFTTPKWTIYMDKERNKPVPFNQNSFNQMISKWE